MKVSIDAKEVGNLAVFHILEKDEKNAIVSVQNGSHMEISVRYKPWLDTVVVNGREHVWRKR